MVSVQFVACRDLVLDNSPYGDGTAPMEMPLRHLAQLTRLVLKGHSDHHCGNTHDKAGTALQQFKMQIEAG